MTASQGFREEIRRPGHPRRHDYENFAARYEQGSPDEGYDDTEVASRYAEVASHVDDDTYRDAATQAVARLRPDQRRQVAALVHQGAKKHGHAVQQPGAPDDPAGLADVLTKLKQADPNLLTQILGAVGKGQSGTPGGSPLGGLAGAVSGAFGGGTSNVDNALGGLLGGGSGGAEKGLLAGIAAFAVKRMMAH
jgi:hypothetical protein